MTHQEAAEAVGRSRSAASNLLRLLKLPVEVQGMLMENKLDMGHARALLSLEPAQQILLGKKIAMEGLSVREAEALVQKQAPSPASVTTKKHKAIDRDTARLQEEVSEKIGARVEIRAGKKGRGKLIIEYGSNDHLEELLARLTHAV